MIETTSNIDSEYLNQTFQRQRKKSLYIQTAPLSLRKEKLKRIRDWILSNEKRIYEAIHSDLRKPLVEVRLTEIRPCIVEIRNILNNLDLWAGKHYVDTPITYLGSRARLKYEPKGVTLIISPWNFPFNLSITPLIASLAAGNTAFLKPSERTPGTSELIKQMVSEIFSEDEVVVFTGDAEVAKEIIKLPFNHIFFTGSSKVGREVMKAASQHLSGLTLELGGKTPTIVDESANLKDAAEKIAWGKFLNCGQTCIAPDYLMVHNSIKKPFIKLLGEQVIQLFSATNDVVSSSDYGRIVDKPHLQRLKTFLQEALEKGASLEIGGSFDESSNYMEPTLLDNVPEDCSLMEEEIFGPILPILSFNDLDEVIDKINLQPKPLALYIFSTNKGNIKKVVKSTSSGSFVVNDCVLQYSHPNLPFGGINESGLGKSHGFSGFQRFSNEKAILSQRIGFTPLKMLYPPYKGFVNWWAKFVTRYL